MKVHQLIKALSEFPSDARVELTRLFAIKDKNEVYNVSLDFPIIGLAHRDDELLLIVEYHEQLAKFGKVVPLKADPEA